ncbi:MAG: 6-phosphogluconolactonase [Lentisphaerae bacterium]|nr:6-phosphogluconolactonase [Lentisphaerota bacterium]
MPPIVNIFDGAPALSTALAARVLACAAAAQAARGRFTLAIPGGSVVELLARGLARVDASNWHVFWTDERCVPLSDPHSNFRMAETKLLPKLAGAQVHPIRGSVADYEHELRPFLPLDLVLLGVGEDGHVASLFPGNAALLETEHLVTEVHGAPKPPPDRVTLTFPVLNAARQTLVVAAGAGKAAIAGRILSLPGELPAQRLSGPLRWLLDRAAAAYLQESP